VHTRVVNTHQHRSTLIGCRVCPCDTPSLSIPRSRLLHCTRQSHHPICACSPKTLPVIESLKAPIHIFATSADIDIRVLLLIVACRYSVCPARTNKISLVRTFVLFSHVYIFFYVEPTVFLVHPLPSRLTYTWQYSHVYKNQYRVGQHVKLVPQTVE